MQKKLSAFPLKIVAIAAMLVNHIGTSGLVDTSTALGYGFYVFSFVVGKYTFPIMAFLLVEGYRHTRNKTKYAVRLGIFSLLSVVPFYLLFRYPAPFTPIELVNNVLFTLLAGLILLMMTDRTPSKLGRAILVVAFALLTIASDWFLLGVVMVYGFYRIKNPLARAVVPVLITMVPYMLLMLSALPLAQITGMDTSAIIIDALGMLGMLLPIPLLLAYNGQRGYSPAWVKWGFYAFYPVHLLVLALIKIL